MTGSLNINKETIRTILKCPEDLDNTKVCARFVPHTLSPEQKEMRSVHCRDIISTAENDPNFLKSIVTGEETWCFQYDPETKRQSESYSSTLYKRREKSSIMKVPDLLQYINFELKPSSRCKIIAFLILATSIIGVLYVSIKDFVTYVNHDPSNPNATLPTIPHRMH
ncbi:FLJ37770-like protein [Trichonephila clavipes]|nr:FLJ37770-like protein [Trichonephila clavipes]